MIEALTLEEMFGALSETRLQTSLIERCQRVRRKPIHQLDNGDLRVLIGQNLDLGFLLPIAIKLLSDEPLLEAELFPGDLLINTLRALVRRLPAHTLTDFQRIQLASIVRFVIARLSECDEDEIGTELIELSKELGLT